MQSLLLIHTGLVVTRPRHCTGFWQGTDHHRYLCYCWTHKAEIKFSQCIVQHSNNISLPYKPGSNPLRLVGFVHRGEVEVGRVLEAVTGGVHQLIFVLITVSNIEYLTS